MNDPEPARTTELVEARIAPLPQYRQALCHPDGLDECREADEEIDCTSNEQSAATYDADVMNTPIATENGRAPTM